MQLTKLRNGDHTNPVEAWGFKCGPQGNLVVGDAFAEELAQQYGTPLQVLDVEGLQRRAREFRCAFEEAYRGEVRVHFAMKCNNTPGVVRLLLEEGIEVEAGSPYEWLLARGLGIDPGRIVVNGPAKRELLEMAVWEGAGLTVVDGLAELSEAERLARQRGRPCPVLLRVNPDYVPAGMNRASATGSRKNSVFGLDTVSGELHEAYRRIARSRDLGDNQCQAVI